jgi:predicted DsbA family dithiol-disulfide isomerase
VSNEDSSATFSIKFMPYLLYPEMASDGEDKYEWYKRAKYNGSAEQMEKYVKVMQHLGQKEQPPIEFDWHGTVAGTLHAHRIVQYFQEEKGPQVAQKIVASLYKQYFQEQQHPSSKDTLLEACTAAGISEKEALNVIDDDYEGLQDVKMLIQEQAGNGVDSVPTIIFEGRKRDFTLTGAKEIDEYVKTLKLVIKESS